MQRQTLRDWLHRSDAEGVVGPLDRPRPTRPRLLSPERLAEFDRIVEAGPDVAVDGVVRWRRVDLKLVVERRFGVVMAERTIGEIRPRPVQPDAVSTPSAADMKSGLTRWSASAPQSCSGDRQEACDERDRAKVERGDAGLIAAGRDGRPEPNAERDCGAGPLQQSDRP